MALSSITIGVRAPVATGKRPSATTTSKVAAPCCCSSREARSTASSLTVMRLFLYGRPLSGAMWCHTHVAPQRSMCPSIRCLYRRVTHPSPPTEGSVRNVGTARHILSGTGTAVLRLRSRICHTALRIAESSHLGGAPADQARRSKACTCLRTAEPLRGCVLAWRDRMRRACTH